MLADAPALRGHRARAARRGSPGACSSRTTCASTTASSAASSRAWTAIGGRRTCAPCACRARCIRRCRATISTPSSNATGSTSNNRHRAMPDAQALLEFWRRLRAAWPPDELQRALEIERAARHAARGAACRSGGRPAGGARRVPLLRRRRAGRRDTLLYVGKANNLRERVLDHFRAGANDAQGATACRPGAARDMDRNRGRARRAVARGARDPRVAAGLQPRSCARMAHASPGCSSDAATRRRLVELDAAGAAFRQRFRHLPRRPRRAPRAREHGARASLVLQGVRPRSRRRVPASATRWAVARRLRRHASRRAMHLARVKLGLMTQRLVPWPHDGPVVVREGQWRTRAVARHRRLATPRHRRRQRVRCAARRDRARSASARRHGFDIDDYRILTRLLRDARIHAAAEA